MNEPTDPIDLGVWDHDDAREGDQENPLEGQPSGDYHLYAERIIDASLAERMADHWAEWWQQVTYEDQDRHFRMEALIKRFGLVEVSKLPSPPEVPDDVKEAARTLSMFNLAPITLSVVRWVLEQAGETNG